ncbi:hypothetical protein [Pontibacter harenae]|uniref:hypothetical protein n=1 Tax=Pontibacter harenae TaxID=2894083 RepID=UPI001E56BAC0|nr:hypothetical protein [Pontibacter harenae]MCC9167936.1 hypothetical protein [Pontibacter harenae]
MQELTRVIGVLVTKLNSADLVNISVNSNSKECIFIQNISNGTYKSDIEASKDLYKAGPNDVRYKMLKHRVRKRLYQLLLSVELSKTKLRHVFQKEQECVRLLDHAQLLLRLAEYDLVLSVCSKVINLASKYGFNSLVLAALELELASLTEKGASKLYFKSKKVYNEYSKVVSQEKEATSLFQFAKVTNKISVKGRKDLYNTLSTYVERLEELWKESGSYDCFNAYYKVSILYYELAGNFDNIIKLTEESAALVEQGIVNKDRFELKYNAYILVYAHLRAKKFDNGLKYADMYLCYFDPHSHNWFSFLENYFLLAVHANQYEISNTVLKQAQSNSFYNKLFDTAKERWKLYSAYLYFISPAAATLESFNYLDLVLSVTEYSKDKQGFNVAILILQFMHFLRRGDAEALLYRIESLKKYILTHLKDSFSLRSKLFLKLLILTVTENFSVSSCRLKGEKHLRKLRETPIPGDAYAEIEIVPYEHLWEFILCDLEKMRA